MINQINQEKYLDERNEVINGIKEVLITNLHVELDPTLINNDQPLFGRGLELDSIDALELNVGILEKFDVQIDDDDTETMASVNKLADYILKTKELD